MNSDIKIVNNLLEVELFEDLVWHMMGAEFPWYYCPHIDYEGENFGLTNFQFEHWFYFTSYDHKVSAQLDLMHPIIEYIDPIALWRIKANLLTNTSEVFENSYHIDIGNLKDEPTKLSQWTTSIYYLNTNNGYTKFEDGTIVESVANRLVTFPANLMHTGTTCSDEKTRVVINFDYFHARSSND